MTEYNLIFGANGGVGTPPTTVQYEEGATVTLPTEVDLTKDGFEFGGWADSDDGEVPVDEPYLMPGEETTLYAIWSIIEKYTLTYDIQGGVGDVPIGGDYAEGQVVGLDDGTGLTKDGFEFGGWSETEGGDAIVGDFEMPGANTVLYAVWVEEEGDNMTEYNLIFEANGGVGTPPTTVQYEEGATVTLPTEVDLTKDGFEFGGWSETEGGDAIVGDFEMPGANTVLYAVWVEEEGDNGGEEGGDNGEGGDEGGQPEDMTLEEFIEECDRINALCRDLKDARDYEFGIVARQIIKETAQDKLMGIREKRVVKIRNYSFDI